MPRSLTTFERNYIVNLPLEPYQKQRIENVWCKFDTPVMSSDKITKEKEKGITLNKWVLIPVLIVQYFYPHAFWGASNIAAQWIGWILVFVMFISYIMVSISLRKRVVLPLMPSSLKRLYEPLPKTIYIHYIGEVIVVYLMYLCGYMYLAIFYAITMIGWGIGANILFTKHTKRVLNGGPEIDLQIAYINEFTLNKE